MVWIQMLNKAYWISMGINFCFHWWDNCIFDCCYVSIIKENDSNTESYDLKSYFIFRVSFALLLLQMDVPEIQKRQDLCDALPPAEEKRCLANSTGLLPAGNAAKTT
ncbi:uncharacterized protein LOC141878840 isoform X2 [Acropora palmata]|uniref:uncharacterized protein LOC141878840 isoform X2 n=1 Tax=Acropora palmata TaxID=6131 RepID=UPI003DA0E4C9